MGSEGDKMGYGTIWQSITEEMFGIWDQGTSQSRGSVTENPWIGVELGDLSVDVDVDGELGGEGRGIIFWNWWLGLIFLSMAKALKKVLSKVFLSNSSTFWRNWNNKLKFNLIINTSSSLDTWSCRCSLQNMSIYAWTICCWSWWSWSHCAKSAWRNSGG